MKRLALVSALAALVGAGCAHFKTEQCDESESGRKITTTATAFTFFSSKSALANFKATQTDKTQGASVGTLNQNSEVSTNFYEFFGTVLGTAIKAAIK